MLNLQKAPTILVPYEMGYALRNLHFLHLSRINNSKLTSLIVADKKTNKTLKKLDLVHKIDLVLKVYGMKWMNN